MPQFLLQLARATRFSAAGIAHLFRSELAARIEAAAALLAVSWLILLRRSLAEIVLLLVLFCVLMSIEALNTASEALIDHISPERSEVARIVKDLGSAAVFFIAVGVGLYVLALTADSIGLIGL